MCREVQLASIRFALDDYCGQEQRDDERLQLDDLLSHFDTIQDE